MKISICIPHYNRIDYLIQSLDIVKLQIYTNFEVIISDDCSNDNSEYVINEYVKSSPFPIIYHRFESNQGYDRNLRKSMELASGDYCFILGNDDALSNEFVLSELDNFLISNNFPDLGFCNYCEFSSPSIVTKRAHYTGIIGSGADVGLRKYSSFSFVAGLIYKKTTFDRFNTSKFDKSIFVQIALSLHMLCNDAVLFSVDKTWVSKDIVLPKNGDMQKSNSYRDFINRKWFSIKSSDGGISSVINVLYLVLKQNDVLTQKRLNYIFHKLLFHTYPFWVLDYKHNRATPAAIGLFMGLQPFKIKQFSELNYLNRIKYICGFQIISLLAFITPSILFFKFKDRLYSWLKRN